MKRAWPAALLACLLTACAGAAPAIEVSAQSHDGLYPVRNTGSLRVWARPDIDLTGYDAILPESAGVQYAPVPRGAAPRSFPIGEEARARFEVTARDAFAAALATVEGLPVADAPGPSVLVVRGRLIDVTSQVPDGSEPGRTLFLDDLGRATLVIELIDSESRAVLLRAVDERRARLGGGLRRSLPARNWGEVERSLAQWAEDLADGLVRVHERFTIR